MLAELRVAVLAGQHNIHVDAHADLGYVGAHDVSVEDLVHPA